MACVPPNDHRTTVCCHNEDEISHCFDGSKSTDRKEKLARTTAWVAVVDACRSWEHGWGESMGVLVGWQSARWPIPRWQQGVECTAMVANKASSALLRSPPCADALSRWQPGAEYTATVATRSRVHCYGRHQAKSTLPRWQPGTEDTVIGGNCRWVNYMTNSIMIVFTIYNTIAHNFDGGEG